MIEVTVIYNKSESRETQKILSEDWKEKLFLYLTYNDFCEELAHCIDTKSLQWKRVTKKKFNSKRDKSLQRIFRFSERSEFQLVILDENLIRQRKTREVKGMKSKKKNNDIRSETCIRVNKSMKKKII